MQTQAVRLQGLCILLKHLSWFEWESLKERTMFFLKDFRDWGWGYSLQAFEVEKGRIILVLYYSVE